MKISLSDLKSAVQQEVKAILEAEEEDPKKPKFKIPIVRFNPGKEDPKKPGIKKGSTKRKKGEKTDAQLARETGVSASTINRVINRKIDPLTGRPVYEEPGVKAVARSISIQQRKVDAAETPAEKAHELSKLENIKDTSQIVQDNIPAFEYIARQVLAEFQSDVDDEAEGRTTQTPAQLARNNNFQNMVVAAIRQRREESGSAEDYLDMIKKGVNHLEHLVNKEPFDIIEYTNWKHKISSAMERLAHQLGPEHEYERRIEKQAVLDRLKAEE